MSEDKCGETAKGVAPKDLGANGSIPNDWAPRKLTRAQASAEQRVYWSRKTIPERLAAMTDLTKRMYRMRGIDLDELKADIAPRRVRRRQG
jgi:hypothetical protein